VRELARREAMRGRARRHAWRSRKGTSELTSTSAEMPGPCPRRESPPLGRSLPRQRDRRPPGEKWIAFESSFVEGHAHVAGSTSTQHAGPRPSRWRAGRGHSRPAGACSSTASGTDTGTPDADSLTTLHLAQGAVDALHWSRIDDRQLPTSLRPIHPLDQLHSDLITASGCGSHGQTQAPSPAVFLTRLSSCICSLRVRRPGQLAGARAW